MTKTSTPPKLTEIIIRRAQAKDYPAIDALLPQLTDFEIPAKRNPDDLWQGDAKLAKQVLDGHTTQSFVEVAVTPEDIVIGVIVVTMRPELMSAAPSAHLEAIVVSLNARGIGLGRMLLGRAQSQAQQRGAKSLSLHVFSNNHRARALYQQDGFDSELIRAIKWFD